MEGAKGGAFGTGTAARAFHFSPNFLLLPAVTSIFIGIKRNGVLGMISNIEQMLHRKARQRGVMVEGVGGVGDWLWGRARKGWHRN